MTVEERYRDWLAECDAHQRRESGRQDAQAFTPEQRQWLDAIKDHIAQSLHVAPEDFDYAPFSQMGGMGKAHRLFGDRLNEILEELNERLVA